MQIITGTNDHYMVALEAGEEVLFSLAHFAQSRELKGGLISGIGALTHVKLGIYNRSSKQYDTKDFGEEEFELISLTGNFTFMDGKYLAHVHAVLGRNDFSTIGGHLFTARISIAGEIFICPLGVLPKRKRNEELRLNFISLDE